MTHTTFKLALIALPSLLMGMATPAMAPEPAPETYFSLMRTNIWTHDQWVEDYNMTLDDCQQAAWDRDGYGDNMSWDCYMQPTGELDGYEDDMGWD